MFNSSRPKKEDKSNRLDVEQLAASECGQKPATPIDQVIAEWQKALVTSAASVASAVAGRPPATASSRTQASSEEEQTEGKLVIIDDHDDKANPRDDNPDATPAAADLSSLLFSAPLPTPGVCDPASSGTPAVSAPPAGGAASMAPSLPTQNSGSGPTTGGGSGTGPFGGPFHPPAYQNVGPGGIPYAPHPYYNYGGSSSSSSSSSLGGCYQPQPAFPAYPSPAPGPSLYLGQQQQAGSPTGFTQPLPPARPVGMQAPLYPGAGGGGGASMLHPLPAPAPEALADQLSYLNLARHNFMQQQQQQQQPQHPPTPIGGLMPPLVPVASPPIISPDNMGANTTNAAGAAGSNAGIDDEWHIDYSELETHKEIARGSFGVVYQGSFRGTEVAIKKLIQQHFSPEQMKDFLDEIDMMKKLHHPNVVLLIGVCVKEPNLCIVTELLAGSMWNLLHDKSVRLDWQLQHKLLLDTAKGMNYLHLFKPPIIHRDLKSPNLLVDSHFNVKIADFGLARIKAQLMTGNLGTCQYMAPEVITSASYSEKADVYSYGVVVWEVLTRQAPWQGMQPMQIAYGVVHQGMRPPIPPGTAPPLVHLMQQCWHQDPAQRPSFAEVLVQLKALPKV